MNSITIIGRLNYTRMVEKQNYNLLNVYVTDDTHKGTVRFHSVFENDEEIEKILSLETGDEITYTGTVFDFSAPYKVIEVLPEQILSLAKVKREYISINKAAEEDSLLQNEKE